MAVNTSSAGPQVRRGESAAARAGEGPLRLCGRAPESVPIRAWGIRQLVIEPVVIPGVRNVDVAGSDEPPRGIERARGDAEIRVVGPFPKERGATIAAE